uniref:NADH-ubiquinone oxidoreductase chain 3 n=1 Tax=Megaris sp. TaxID=2931300 RepID=A0A8T9ZW24_9HEMI|nr:NADH dehydrogenase subunit 3 [Megaris sp.]
MYKMIISVLMMSLIISMIYLLCSIISKKTMKMLEKMSSFECGFNSMSSSRLPFSIQFFLITVLFLIFDVEIVILLPIILSIKSMYSMTWLMTTNFIIIIITAGILHEWKNGALKWK